METTYNVCVIGASGLIGSELLGVLDASSNIRTITTITRKPLVTASSKTKNVVIDFTDLTALEQAVTGCNIVFCCIGTTMKNVKGNKQLYRTIDLDIPINTAKCALQQGCTQFVLVSSVGANAKSSNFYLSLKGEVEEALSALPFKAIHIMRPSLLLGNRKEYRLAEKISQKISKHLRFLFPSIYKPIEATQVAKAMLTISLQNKEGKFIYHYDDLTSLSK